MPQQLASSGPVRQLLQALQDQGQQYRDLLKVLESFNAAANANDTHSQAILNSIQHQMAGLHVTSSDCARIRGLMNDDDVANSAELQMELKMQESLLQDCLNRISELENGFASRKQRLQPELDDTARRRSMQNAYQRSLSTG